VAGQLGEIDLDVGPQMEVDGIAFWVARVGNDLGDLVAIRDQAFGEEKAGGEFFVVAWSAHGNADGTGFDLDLERFFNDEPVRELFWRLAGDPFENGALLGVQWEKDEPGTQKAPQGIGGNTAKAQMTQSPELGPRLSRMHTDGEDGQKGFPRNTRMRAKMRRRN